MTVDEWSVGLRASLGRRGCLAQGVSRLLKNYLLRCRFVVKNRLGCEPRLGAPVKMLIYTT